MRRARARGCPRVCVCACVCVCVRVRVNLKGAEHRCTVLTGIDQRPDDVDIKCHIKVTACARVPDPLKSALFLEISVHVRCDCV